MKVIPISLGGFCDPRAYIKVILKYSKKKGYNSCPFDLCITSFKQLCDVLKTDFEYFFDDLKIIPWENARGKRKLAGPGLSCITNKYGIIFNHEGSCHSHLFKEGKNDDEFYTRDNFKEFKKRYLNRINNFKKYCKDYNDIIFVYKYDNFDESVITNIITNKYGKKNIKFIKIP
tara:strand:- start:40 stop:561 length:522 start_codon:yes stop_codon:yes gene_type:complete